LSNAEQLEYLNNARENNFDSQKQTVAGDYLDTMELNELGFFSADEEAQKSMGALVDSWSTTRDNVKDGILSKM